ncbi:AAA family ATPase [Thermomonospora sp. CIF 1]|uniref:nucleotide-binding protein n=1 Tax=Thermomonospora sp. CIF 1 TaxID=1916083 RepID=UPI000B142382|nr:AAA family ATPase [Thermomonospora sp. CIF 1]
MSDRDWQHAVLRELGAAEAGLADPRPPGPVPSPAPAATAAEPQPQRTGGTSPSAWYPEGVVSGEEPAAGTAPPVLSAPPPPGREPTATFKLPPKKSQPPPAGPEHAAPQPPGPAPSHETAADRHVAGAVPAQAGPSEPPSWEEVMAAHAQATGAEPAAPSPPPPPPSLFGRPAASGDAQPPAAGENAPGPAWTPTPAGGEAPAAPVTGVPDRPGDDAAAHPLPAPPQAPRPAAPQPPAPAGDAEVSAEALVRRKAHGDSALRRVGRGVRKMVGATAAGDMREMTGMVQRLQSPVPSCRRIAVTSIRGGAGKTTVAALLASVIAEHREDRVLAMDADSGLGSLALRLNVRPERSIHDLAAARPRSWEETAPYLSRTEQGLWVMSGTARGRVSELDLETFQAAASGVSRYFSAAVIDCGAGIVERLQRGVLAAAHAQVFVAPGTVDGALSARHTLSWFVGSGYEQLLSRTVVTLVTHSPHADGDADLERARQILSDGGLPVVVVPYDRHLATGTAITPGRVSGGVRTAVSWIAAEVFARSLTGGTQ